MALADVVPHSNHFQAAAGNLPDHTAEQIRFGKKKGPTIFIINNAVRANFSQLALESKPRSHANAAKQHNMERKRSCKIKKEREACMWPRPNL